jgi:hypothetical protein
MLTRSLLLSMLIPPPIPPGPRPSARPRTPLPCWWLTTTWWTSSPAAAGRSAADPAAEGRLKPIRLVNVPADHRDRDPGHDAIRHWFQSINPPAADPVDTSIGQFLPTALDDSGGRIASYSDRRTLAFGSAVACGASSARSGIVPALAHLGVGPLQQPARHGPNSPAIAPQPARGRSMPPAGSLRSAWASCPVLVGHRARPDSLRPQYSLGGLGSSPNREKGMGHPAPLVLGRGHPGRW